MTKPSRIKAIEGDRNKGKNAPTGPEVSPKGALVKPNWLGSWGSAEWDLIVDSMPPDFFTRVDASMLAQYCNELDCYHKARLAVDYHGIVTADEKLSPAFKAMHECVDRLQRLAKEFGFSPRARVGLAYTPQEESSPEDEFLRLHKTG